MGLNKRLINQEGVSGPVGTDHFDIITYTGNGNNNRSFSSLDFSPNWVWFKNRSIGSSPSGPFSHSLYDTFRGTEKELKTDSNQEEQNNTDGLTNFDSNGFTIGDDPGTNFSNQHTYVAWCWKASNTTSTNYQGQITSYTNVNDDAGFAIVKTTFEGGARDIGHGMASTPELIIGKKYGGGGGNWSVYHKDLGNNQGLLLNSSSAVNSAYDYYDEAPTSTTFKYDMSGSGGNIYYLFYSVDGYQKVGSYSGTGTTSSFTGFGFEPRWIMIKSAASGDWWIFDNVRGNNKGIRANLSSQEDTTDADANTNEYRINFLSDGFQYEIDNSTNASSALNAHNVTYIYLAIA